MADLDPNNTVVLSMDFQNDIVSGVGAGATDVLERASRVLAQARASGVPVIHIVVRFRPGHPEIGTRGLFTMARQGNRFVEGMPGAEIHAAVAPQQGDIVITKKRVSAFAGSDLECVLRASGRTHLVLFGFVTSGVVLSTIRAAADLDYTMNVVSDCCGDREPEVHQFLIERVFPRMAPALTAEQCIAALHAV